MTTLPWLQHLIVVPVLLPLIVGALLIPMNQKRRTLKFALSLGAVRFLEKPIDTEEFLLTVAEILTMGVPTMPRPMDEHTFYMGYRDRLEAKLRHKNTQIMRTERLLQTLQPDQQPAFQALLNSAINDRDEIEGELASLLNFLNQNEGK